MSRSALRSPLGPGYRRLWLASAVSNLGDGVTRTAAPLLAVTLTRDPRLVSGLTAALMLPWLLFALPSGAIVDRVDRRLLMSLVDALRGVAVALLALAVSFDWAGLPMLYVVFFLLGVGETLFDSATNTVIPALVPADRLEDANGRLVAAETGANELVGPAVGGFLFASAAALPFFVDAASFAWSAALVLTLRGSLRATTLVSDGAPAPHTTLRAEIGVGLRWLWRHALLRQLTIAASLLNLLSGAIFAVYVLYAQDRLGLGEIGYGFFLAAGAVGGIAGSLFAGKLVDRLGRGRILAVAAMFEGATDVVLGLTRNAVVAACAAALGLFAAFVWSTVSASLRQMLTPDELLGRVSGAYRLASYGTVVFGAIAGGFVVEATNAGVPFLYSAAVLTLVGCWSLVVFPNRVIEESRARAG